MSTASAAPAATATAPLTVESLLSVLRAASAEQMAELLTELNRGMPLWSSPLDGKATTARAKMAARAAAAAALLPECADGEAPDASAYRVDADEIDHTVCVGRRLSDSTKDTRWKPAVYREFQCAKALSASGGDLCETCRARKDRYDATPSPKVEWMGRITEEPLGWLHMLGTDWASGPKAPKWNGGDGGSDAASVSSDGSGATEQMSTVSVSTAAATSVASKAEAAAATAAAKLEEAKAKATAKLAEAAKKAEEKAAAAAAKAEAKAAEAKAKAEAKEAEKKAKEEAKAAAAAAKEKAKAEAAAAKAAEKATKEAAKAAPKSKPATGAGSGATAAAKAEAMAPKPVSAKAAAATTEVAETEGEVKLLGSDLYIVKGGNVYEYDSATEKAGKLLGVLNEDGESFEPVSDSLE